MAKQLDKNIMQVIAGRDQAMAFIRDHQQTIATYAISHPDALTRALAGFALAELANCPDISFTSKEDEDG